jgi:hypothetical protein
MHSLHHTLLDICMYRMMQSYLWQMVHTRATEEVILNILEGSAGRGHGQVPCANAPPLPPPHPPVSLEQLLMENETRRGLTASNPNSKTEIPCTRIFW